jgi:hypothetical protein
MMPSWAKNFVSFASSWSLNFNNTFSTDRSKRARISGRYILIRLKALWAAWGALYPAARPASATFLPLASSFMSLVRFSFVLALLRFLAI